MDNDFSHDLSAWLSATTDRYVVERTIKDTPSEVTQVVFRRGANGKAEAGPFVRKIFADTSLGMAYRTLLDAQTSGTRFHHLPLVYECEQTGTTYEVVMECVRGTTLADYVRQTGPGTQVASLVMPQLCDALDELHAGMSQPVIHRDVKPSNIMVGNGHVTLIDLGIARTYRDNATRDTVRYGTPGYAPPEQFGYGQTSVRSDVYAAGMTLAFCLLGEDPTPRLAQDGFADERISPTLRKVLVAATRFDPAQRYGSAQELKNAFNEAIGSSTRHPVAVPAPLGKLWNVLVAFMWALLLAALARGIVQPVESLAQAPRWLLVVMYVGVFVIPFTALGYLLLDKRRFSHPSWRRYVPVCVGAALLGILAAMLAYLVAF